MEENDGTYVKYSTLSLLASGGNGGGTADNSGRLSEKTENIISENKMLKSRVESIENSDAYKLALKLYEMGQSAKPVKKLIKKLLNK